MNLKNRQYVIRYIKRVINNVNVVVNGDCDALVLIRLRNVSDMSVITLVPEATNNMYRVKTAFRSCAEYGDDKDLLWIK